MDFKYYNPYDTYVASQMVNYGHYLSSTDFCRSQEYYDKAMVTPIVISSICAFMLLCFFMGMCGRMFWQDCKCRPPREDKEEFDKQKALNATLFYILAILVLVVDQLVFVGNGEVDTAVETLHSATGTVKRITYDMHDGGTVLLSMVGDLTSAWNDTARTCATNSTALRDIYANITAYASSAQLYTTSIEPIQDFLSDVDDGITEYGILYRQAALYFIWALAVVFAAALLTLKWLEFRYGMKQVMWFGVCTYILYVCLCLPWTFATSVLADLCVEPSYNAVKSMPVRDSIRNIGAYFSTCTGNCTLTTSIDAARSSVLSMNASAVSLLNSDCFNNTDLQSFRMVLDSVDVSLQGVAATMACGPIQDQWFEFWNNGVCRQLYRGTFFVWGSQILTSLFLFVLIVCVSITYQFYGDPKSPYPLLNNSKVLPTPIAGASPQSSIGSVTMHKVTASEIQDGFGDMVQTAPQRQVPPISRVMSFQSDMSEELNSAFF